MEKEIVRLNAENSVRNSEDEAERPSELLPIVIKRRWYFLAPLFTIGLLGYALANVLPLQYRSSALLIVEQRKVPDNLVAPNILMTLQKRLDSMTQQILSRTRLQRFIEDFGLYQNERRRMSMDDVIDMMHKRITVEIVAGTGQKNDLTGFKINFSDHNRYVAQRITNEFTSLFIEQDARERTSQSQQTTAFLESQLEDARNQLASLEKRVSEYKLTHLGELPSQQDSNLRILSSLEVQLAASTAALDRAEQQRIYLESMLAQQQAFSGPSASTPTNSIYNPDRVTVSDPGQAKSLAVAQTHLDELIRLQHDLASKYTDKHPDMVRLKREIADLENTVQHLKSEPVLDRRSSGKLGSATVVPVPTEPKNSATVEITSRLKAVLAEIEAQHRDTEELRGRIRQVQDQLGKTPVREQEMADIMRQYDSAKANYQSLLEKKLGSQLATNLEERQGGDHIRLLDPATLPNRPEGRQKIVMMAWLLAFGIGTGLVVLREMLDGSVHRNAHLEKYEPLPVLVRIPTLHMVAKERRQRVLRKLEVVGVTCMVLISIAAGVQTLLG